ncbi:MAG: hypothetical protein AAGF26_16455 [Cyanobacteria bacterium P01_G01_bin.49]
MWNWLKKLSKSVKNFFAGIFQAFVEWILYLIEVAYLSFLTSLILTHFGYAVVLYFMFYVVNGQAVVEVWEPQESSVIKHLEPAPSGVNKPNRQEAKVYMATR